MAKGLDKNGYPVENNAKDNRGTTVMAGTVNGGLHVHSTPRWIWLIVVTVMSLIVVSTVFWVRPTRSTRIPGVPVADSPAPAPVALRPSSDQPAASTAPASTAPAPTAQATQAPVAVWWTGTLPFDLSGLGSGYDLDQQPPVPVPSAAGDIFYSNVMALPGGAGEVNGIALVQWLAAAPPTEQQCAQQIKTYRNATTAADGDTMLNIEDGAVDCLVTSGGRIGYFTIESTASPADGGQPETSLHITVWNNTPN